MLELLRRQFTEGYANRNDVALQEAQLAQVKTTLPPLRKALAIQRDLLAALAGRFPSQEPKETFTLAKVSLPTDLPVSLPLQLVEQRPDVRSAEELLHSASAEVGVATANMLPNITIGANGGYNARSLPACSPRRTCFGYWRATRPRRCSTGSACCMSGAPPMPPSIKRDGTTAAPSSPPSRTSPMRCAPSRTTPMP